MLVPVLLLSLSLDCHSLKHNAAKPRKNTEDNLFLSFYSQGFGNKNDSSVVYEWNTIDKSVDVACSQVLKL